MKYTNFLIFIISLSILIFLQSHDRLSTSLLSVIPNDDTKEMIETFNQTENSRILFIAVKGSDPHALNKIKKLEKELTALPLISQKQITANNQFQKHQEEYKLYSHKINESKLSDLNVSQSLKKLYVEMTTSFFPVSIDKTDPFKLVDGQRSVKIRLKNAHLFLGEYGYFSIFLLNSDTLDEHKKVYQQIHYLTDKVKDVQVFSPLFYYVENSQAITSDVNNIIFIALGILLLLYVYILRNILLLSNTLATLATSAIVATIVLTQLYGEVSIFVFVFGVSISTVAIDYMFHHYLHGYYTKHNSYNREVFFGFLTTISAFTVLSFTSFLLIKQIAIFSILSLAVSYLHFSFLYPKIGFEPFKTKEGGTNKNRYFLSPKILFSFSLIIIVISPLWIRFDFNLKNLDYDNKTLKNTERFFMERLDSSDNIAFAVKADNIDTLITYAQMIQQNVDSAHLPLSVLVSRQSYEKNKAILESMSPFKKTLNAEAEKLGFKKEYFKDAYRSDRPFINYSEEEIKLYGLNILKINSSYITYGTVSKEAYDKVLTYDFVESISLKEHFEKFMKTSVNMLLKLGLFALLIILILLYYITRKNIVYAIVFLLFPTAMVSVYAYLSEINILHIFMLFIIVSIGIDYAVYLSKKSDKQTKKAIAYSLVSTFAGFGVLIFSNVNALFSMGIVATIGIVSIAILLVFVKRVNNVS